MEGHVVGTEQATGWTPKPVWSFLSTENIFFFCSWNQPPFLNRRSLRQVTIWNTPSRRQNWRKENEVRNNFFFRDVRHEMRRCIIKEFSRRSGGEKEVGKVCLGNVRKAGVGGYKFPVGCHCITQSALLLNFLKPSGNFTYRQV
jgi:hypothetical protein